MNTDTDNTTFSKPKLTPKHPTTESTDKMQAIETKILPATNNKPVRIKASCSRGSLTVSPPIHDKESGHEDNHVAVADLLCARFVKEDEKEYNSPPSKNPWSWRRVVGGTKAGYAHVFVE